MVADGGRGAEKALRRDARERGEPLVGQRRVGRHLAVELQADGALRRPGTTSRAALVEPPSSSSKVKPIPIEVRASAIAVPGQEPVEVVRALVTLRVRRTSIARWSVDLPASLGPRMTVSPGASSTVVSRYRRELAQRERP